MTYKKILPAAIFVSLLSIVLVPATALAHVIVTPNQAGIGQELIFSESVPNEQQTAVTSVKLLIPAGVTDVIPTEKPGWNIVMTSNNNPADPEITAITWTGNIPVGERDDFTFNAQMPANPTTLDWKAYQTYADGTVVHWDQKPAGSDDSTGNAGPYSTTNVINDLSTSKSGSSNNSTLPLVLSIIAVVVSAGSLLFRKAK